MIWAFLWKDTWKSLKTSLLVSLCTEVVFISLEATNNSFLVSQESQNLKLILGETTLVHIYELLKVKSLYTEREIPALGRVPALTSSHKSIVKCSGI